MEEKYVIVLRHCTTVHCALVLDGGVCIASLTMYGYLNGWIIVASYTSDLRDLSEISRCIWHELRYDLNLQVVHAANEIDK